MIFKRTFQYSFIIILLFIGCQLPLSAQNFEGIIYYEVPALKSQGMGRIPYMVKNSKARIEFGQGNQKGFILLLPESNQMMVFNYAIKGFMVLNLSKHGSHQKGTNIGINKIEKVKTIAGKKCSIWDINSKKYNFEICMAKGLGTFTIPAVLTNIFDGLDQLKSPQMDGLMPLEVVKLQDGGNDLLQIKVTKIQEKKLDDDLFMKPEGYSDKSRMLMQMIQQAQS